MFPVIKSIDRPPSPQRTFRSLLVSVCLHGALAVLLAFLVSGVVRRPSISLTASPSSPAGDARLEFAEIAPPTLPVVASSQFSSVDSQLAIESLLSQSMESDSLSDTVAGNFEPTWVEFFGTRAYGNRFVFVLDISYSMKARQGDRFNRACEELLRSVSALQTGQSYYVFLFSWSTEKMFYDPVFKYVEVAPGHEGKLRRWIYGVSLGAGTDPRRALALAHQMKPEAVFLLSDGHFNRPGPEKTESGWIDASGERFEADVQEGVELLFRNLPIHAIAFENPFTLSAMQQIAAATGGSCRYIPTRSHRPIDAQRFLTALRHIDQKHRHDRQPRDEYLTRLSYAREFIRDGELAYAEYLVRPLRHAKESMIANPVLLAQVFEILDRELGGGRLEDFEPPPELREILGRDS